MKSFGKKIKKKKKKKERKKEKSKQSLFSGFLICMTTILSGSILHNRPQ